MSLELINGCSTRGFHRWEDGRCRDCLAHDERDGNVLLELDTNDFGGRATRLHTKIHDVLDKEGVYSTGDRMAVLIAVAWGIARRSSMSAERFLTAMGALIAGREGEW